MNPDLLRSLMLLGTAVVTLSFTLFWTIGYLVAMRKRPHVLPESRFRRFILVTDANGFPFSAGFSASVLLLAFHGVIPVNPWIGVAINTLTFALGLIRWIHWRIVVSELNQLR